ncbi:MAG: hypothetical protein RBR45_11920 [Pseudomonas sp.]|nr:hypothetical protein [Pseudomonas sp.]
MNCAEHTAFMLPSAASAHASEVRMKDVERRTLAAQVAQFMKENKVPELKTRRESKVERLVFNNSIAVAPAKRAERQQEKEALHAAIAELSCIEIEGVTIIRSAYEVSAMLRQRGFRLLSPSVKRVAESIGIYLRA